MEADGARFLWLDEYRHHEIFEGFGSPEEPGRWSATLVGTLSDTESTEPSDTCGHTWSQAPGKLCTRAHDQNWGRVRPENRILRPWRCKIP